MRLPCGTLHLRPSQSLASGNLVPIGSALPPCCAELVRNASGRVIRARMCGRLALQALDAPRARPVSILNQGLAASGGATGDDSSRKKGEHSNTNRILQSRPASCLVSEVYRW